MKEKVQSLLRLQDVALNINRLNAFLQTVADKLATLDATQSALQVAYDTEAATMNLLKKKYRDLELDLQGNTAQIKKSHDKLNAVKNNKEYQAILREIDDTKDRNFVLEDEMIACLERMEALEKELEEKKKILEGSHHQVTEAKEAIRVEAEDDIRRLAEAEAQQAELLLGVENTLLSDYLRVKRIVKGPAVVPVQKCVCQGCFLNIPPQMFIELQRGDKLKFCPHCDRILYWDEMIQK